MEDSVSESTLGSPIHKRSGAGTAVLHAGWVNLDFLALLLILVVVNVVYWGRSITPLHDTKGAMLVDYYFYNHLLTEGEWPRWVAYGHYGLEATNYQLTGPAPVDYLVGLFGWILHVQNFIRLFKVAMLGNHLLLLVGVYLLSRRLFVHRLTTFVVSLTVILSANWLVQIYFFRLWYWVPLALWLLLGFFCDKKPHCLWIAGVVAVISVLGCPPYFIVVFAFVLAIFSAMLLPNHWPALLCLREVSWRNGLSLLLLLSVVAGLGVAVGTMQKSATLIAVGRDPEKGTVTLEHYLTYGSSPHIRFAREFAGVFWRGRDRDFSVYIGLFTWIALAIAALRARNALFYALFGTGLVVLVMSFCGTFATVTYFFPGMSRYRHVELLAQLARVFLAVAAGFGYDWLFSHLAIVRQCLRKVSRPQILFLLLMLWGVFDMATSTKSPWFLSYLPQPPENTGEWFSSISKGSAVALAARLVAYALAFWKLRQAGTGNALGGFRLRRLCKGVLVAAVAFDMVSFQLALRENAVRSRPPIKLPMSPFPWRDQRTADVKRLPLLQVLSHGERAIYEIFMTVVQADACRPMLRLEWFPRGVDMLLRLRGGKPKTHPDEEYLPANDPALMRVLGCSAPKLRLMSQVMYTDTTEEAELAVATIGNLDKVLVLRGVPEEERTPGVCSETCLNGVVPNAEKPRGTINVLRYNANHLDLEVFVEGDRPVWLVYAEAYHPGWHAQLNGQPVPIHEAYLGFKAVRVEPGRNRLDFLFHNGRHTWAMEILMCVAIGVGLMIVGLCIVPCLIPPDALLSIMPWPRPANP